MSQSANRPSSPSLFPLFARQNDTRTSRLAAASAEPKTKTQRDRVLDDIRFCGRYGTTQSAIVARMRIPLQSVCARVNELGEMGLVLALSVTRETASGCNALVFVTPEHVDNRELEPWPARRVDLSARVEALEESVRRLEAVVESLRRSQP